MTTGHAAVLEWALARPPGLGRTRLICVDGPAGSGKTTFADELVALAHEHGLTVALVHMDDVFEGWDGLADAGRRLLDQVVAPLAAGSDGAYARYDWHEGTLAETVRVPASELLVIEGVGSGDPAYAPQTSLLVWVWAPAEVRLSRGLERDGTALEQHWKDWMVAEEQLHTRDRTAERADVVVDGRTGAFSRGPGVDA